MTNTTIKYVTRRTPKYVNAKLTSNNNDHIVSIVKNYIRIQKHFDIRKYDIKDAVKFKEEIEQLVNNLPNDKWDAAKIMMAHGGLPYHPGYLKEGYPDNADRYVEWVIDETDARCGDWDD